MLKVLAIVIGALILSIYLCFASWAEAPAVGLNMADRALCVQLDTLTQRVRSKIISEEVATPQFFDLASQARLATDPRLRSGPRGLGPALHADHGPPAADGSRARIARPRAVAFTEGHRLGQQFAFTCRMLMSR